MHLMYWVLTYDYVVDLGTAGAPCKVKLGGSSLQVSELGLGTLQWGDPTTGFGERYDEVTAPQRL